MKTTDEIRDVLDGAEKRLKGLEVSL